jgi:hypothetical protein
MNRILWEEQLTPIEADYARWCDEQGALLRSGKLDAIDRENLAEEIESLGRSERREIESRLNILLLHLLRWKFQSEKRKSGWKGSILEASRQLRRILAESPSLKNYPAQILREEYEIARLKAADETGLGEDNFPQECPFTMDDIFDETFLPAGK